jgi:RND family efflux transporter MFP subunit
MSDNLHALRRRDRDDSKNPDPTPPKRKFKLPSLAKTLPWLLLAAFVLLAWLLFGDRFERARPVDLLKVVTMRASAKTPESAPETKSGDELSFEGSTLFQASGWIESDPLPIRVTTLYSGVVDKVHVLQGEMVKQGQVLALMVDEDARLNLQQAKADLAQAKAELEQRKSTVAATEAALQTLAKEIAAAESRGAELTDQFERLEKAGKDVFRESEISQAKLRVSTQERTIEALQSSENELKARLRSDRAATQAALARVDNVKVNVDRRQLDLDRTQVRSPVDGRIQELYAAPGIKRMLNMDGLETATIAKVFQPESLQARIDVPLEEAAQLRIGQPVRLRSTLLPNQNFKGQVTRIDGQADIQRNTLQAKVKLLNPDDQLRPEMLCRAEFLSGGQNGGSSAKLTPSSRAAIYVPEAVLEGSGRERTVWALGADGERVELRNVVVDLNPREGHLRVLEGLRPGDFVVQNPPSDLEAGERVKTNKSI